MRSLCEGGRLIYSTCSLEAEENETVVAEVWTGRRAFVSFPAGSKLEPWRIKVRSTQAVPNGFRTAISCAHFLSSTRVTAFCRLHRAGEVRSNRPAVCTLQPNYCATLSVAIMPGSTRCPDKGLWLNTVPAGSTVPLEPFQRLRQPVWACPWSCSALARPSTPHALPTLWPPPGHAN